MAFLTIGGFSPTNSSENSNGIPNFGTSPYQSPTGDNWQDAFLDTLQESRYQHLSGVLSGGVCTVSGLVVTVPASTVFVAGGMVWTNASGETQSVTDDATSYVWACADGQLRITSTTTPPTGFDSGKSCILTRAVAVSGTATIDNGVQHRAETADHTNRMIGGAFAVTPTNLPSGGYYVVNGNSQYVVFGDWYNYATFVTFGTTYLIGGF